MSADFSLNLVNHYQCQLSSGGDIEDYSLEGTINIENRSATTSVKELIIHLAITDKNITSDVKFEDVSPSSSQEKELLSVKLNPIDNPLPVIVTETVSTVENLEENFRVVYSNKENQIFDRIKVRNQGSILVPKIRITKNVESFPNVQENQIKAESGKFTLNSNAIIWDIENLKPGQSATLTCETNIKMGSERTLVNGWISLIYEIPPNQDKNKFWAVKKIEIEAPPKISEQILYDLAIPEISFEIAKIGASRTILSVQLKDAEIVQAQFESVLKNQGTVPIDNIEIIHQFPKVVELPNASEVTLSLRGMQISNTNFEVSQTPSEVIPDCTIFRVFIRNMKSIIGGFQGGEEIHVSFPIFVKTTFDQGILKYPTYFNAQVKSDTPLLEETVGEAKVDKTLVNPNVPQSSFETEVITKFSTLAVEAYNAQKYEDALAYSEQILSVAQKIEDKTIIQNFVKITEKLRKIVSKNVPAKGN